jgi:AcrR family transcriptional regulator
MPKVVPEYRAQAKARIVEAAHTVFHRKGFGRTSLADIAREVGVSKGALYVYFPNKTALLQAVQTSSREEIRARLALLLDAGDVAEGLASLGDLAIDRTADPGVFHDLVIEAARNPALRRALVEDEREDSKVIQAFLRELSARGRIPKVKDVETTASILIAIFAGTIFGTIRLGHDPKDAHRFLVRAFRQVLRT